ncbi:MAG TPA: ATP-binding protein [Candidatus Nanopelagicales bacterium]|nr:ATP-binding protein [Candidatus Nanopelagicales bacterium]
MDMQRHAENHSGHVARKLLEALDLTGVLRVGLDSAGRVRVFNSEAERITGLPCEDVIGARFVDALVPEPQRSLQGGLIEELAAGSREAGEVLEGAILSARGELRQVRWLSASVPPERPGDVTLFLIGQDSTDRRAWETRARRIEKLAAAGSLVAGLAHELRNPLNGAHLHVTLLDRTLRRSGQADEEVLSALQVVQGEIRRLSQLVSDFLDFARPQPLDFREVSLRALCERALSRVAHLAARSGVVISDELPPAERLVEVDPGKVELALLNLLRNAIEAVGESGGGTVSLRAEVGTEAVVLEVEDNGPGVDDAEAPIFDPFYSTKPTGTGLGLAIVQRVVSDHDGVVELTSKPGQTVFRLKLPSSLPDKERRST